MKKTVSEKIVHFQVTVLQPLDFGGTFSNSIELYSAFVVHWTDYSPGRAKPLDRDVRPLADKASAVTMAEQFIEQNIKKGWQLIE